MSIKESVQAVLDGLPEEKQREVLEFAEFLRWSDERAAWQAFGRAEFARAYGPNEPE